MGQDDFLLELQAKLDEAKSKELINDDIREKLQGKLDTLKLQAKLDENSVNQIIRELEHILGQKIDISVSANIDGNAVNQVKKVSDATTSTVVKNEKKKQEAIQKTNSTLRSFSELKIADKGNISAIFDKDEILDIEESFKKIKKEYSEFGQVKITDKIFDSEGNIKTFKVNIQQVNGELKETRSFMMELAEDGKSFRFPEDIIKGSESYIHHLDEAKNLTNETGEALNAQKQKLAEQEKYYDNLKKETKHRYDLEKQILSAGELETKELQNQLNTVKKRVKYNEDQIDKKGLKDNSLEREVSNLEVEGKNRLKVAEAKKQDAENTKQLVQEEKELLSTLKEIEATQKKADKIQLSLDTGEYESKVQNLIARTQQWTDENGNARISTVNLENSLNELQIAYENLSKSGTVENQQVLIEKEKELETQIKSVTSEVRTMNAQLAKSSAVDSLHNQVIDFMSKNGKTVRYYKTELTEILNGTATGAKLTKQELTALIQKFSDLQIEARNTGKLGKTVFQTLKEGISSFTSWVSATTLVMTAINKTRQAVSTVKELDTALVDLRKTAHMSAQELENFYYASNDTAKQMGVTTEEILKQAAAWSRLGFNTAEQATQMAKYSSMFAMISPGMDIDDATDGLVSMMKAFKIGAEDVNEVVDGIMSKVNIIGNTRALNNSDIVEFLTRSSSAMAEANNTLEETIALGTAMVEITRDASNAGQVLKTVSMRIRGYDEQTEEYIGGIEELSGKIADLTKTASTPGGISLFSDEAKTEYKSTLQLFREISEIYDDLTDKDQAALLEVLAGKRNGQAVAAILNNFEAVEDSLNSMANSAGNAEAEMAIAMDSIDYKLNELKETGTSISQNLFAREDIKNVIDFSTDFLEIIDKITEKLGLFGSISLGAGLFGGIKNIGKTYKCTVSNYCFECALHA